jgi:hypothetical protein
MSPQRLNGPQQSPSSKHGEFSATQHTEFWQTSPLGQGMLVSHADEHAPF